MATIQETFAREQIRSGINAASPKKTGPRPSVHESHHGNLGATMSKLRELGHSIVNIKHSGNMKAGQAHSVIHHKSGKSLFKTMVHTKFNLEDGGDHHAKVSTYPMLDDKKHKEENMFEEEDEE